MPRCIYCNNDNFIIMIDKPGYEFLLCTSETDTQWIRFQLLVGCCTQCGLITLLELPDKELLNRIYGKYYKSYPSCAPLEDTERRIQEFVAAFSNFPSHGSTLEIGSYDGRLLNVLRRRGLQVLGCDPNSSAADHAKTTYGIDTVQEYFRPNLFGNAQFDLVLSRLLLEHVLEPQILWVELNRMVGMGGQMAHEVPNCHYTLESGLPFFLPEHTTFFTPDSFVRLIESVGYEVDELQVTSGFLRTIATKIREAECLSLDSEDKQGSIRRDMAIARRYIERFNEQIEQVDAFFEEMRSKQMRMAVYGTGYFFTNLVNFTSLDLGEITFACDSNVAKWGIMVPGLKDPVQPPDQIKYPDIGLVIIATQTYQEVLSRLKNYLDVGGNALYFAPQPTIVHPSFLQSHN
jgi:hypothetical protein